jgi:hypothetical protein
MKVRELIAALSKADPEADVCYFSDDRSGAQSLEYVAVWRGAYDRTMQSNALRSEQVEASFVGLLNPGDFEHSGVGFARVNDLHH